MKNLVAYFSASGVTAGKARALAELTGSELYEIQPEEAYTRADLDWTNKKSRSFVEMHDPDSRPALAERIADVSPYDVVYIGFPIWWGVAPHVVNTFMESSSLEGKEIVLFATSGGSGIEMAVQDMRERYPALDIRGGRLLNGRVDKDIRQP